jgi:hypothetical protein
VVIVVVNVDVVCGSVVVVICGVVVITVDCTDDVVVVVCGAVVFVSSEGVVVVFDFSGVKTVNFNTRERVTATIVKTIKEIHMILTQR